MFDQILTSIAAARTPGERVRAYARAENAACAARLWAMADMLAAAHAADGSAERDQWRLDNWATVCAQIGAPTRSPAAWPPGYSWMRSPCGNGCPRWVPCSPRGLISYRLVHAICTRTTLVRDPDALRALDAELAAELRHRGAMSVCEAERTIDSLVLKHDPDGVHRTEAISRACSVDVFVEDSTGIAHVSQRGGH